MTDLREAAKLALEALEINLIFLKNVKPFNGQEDLASDCIAMTDDTIAALKRALAEDAMNKDYARGYVAGMDSQLFANDTSQERVDKAEEQRHEPIPWVADMKIDSTNALEVPRVKWVGLTDEEYKELHLQMGAVYFYQEYGRAVEAKLKERNT